MLKNMNLTKANNLKKQRVIKRIFISGTVCTIILAIGCCVQIHRVNSYRFNEPPSMVDKQADILTNFTNNRFENNSNNIKDSINSENFTDCVSFNE